MPALLPGAMLAGLVVHVRALVRRAPPGRAGTVVMGSVAAPVIMRPEFDNDGMFMAGFCLCRCRSWCCPFGSQQAQAALIVDTGSGMARGFASRWVPFGWPRSSSITAVVWLAGFASRWVPFECRQALAALIVDNGSAVACWFYLALCSLRLMAGCHARHRHRQRYVHGWPC